MPDLVWSLHGSIPIAAGAATDGRKRGLGNSQSRCVVSSRETVARRGWRGEKKRRPVTLPPLQQIRSGWIPEQRGVRFPTALRADPQIELNQTLEDGRTSCGDSPRRFPRFFEGPSKFNPDRETAPPRLPRCQRHARCKPLQKKLWRAETFVSGSLKLMVSADVVKLLSIRFFTRSVRPENLGQSQGTD